MPKEKTFLGNYIRVANVLTDLQREVVGMHDDVNRSSVFPAEDRGSTRLLQGTIFWVLIDNHLFCIRKRRA
jgi:hypothetical protein